jgi:cytosine/adenosine deaminase-related metal-dependent hydrolase
MAQPLPSQKLVLRGRVVTMDDAFTVVADGAVYVAGNAIAAVQAAGAPAPPGFDQAKSVDTKGTIYPGLVELHNHLSYNALQLWAVPKKYTNRDEWPKEPQYHQLVTGPMGVLGKSRNQTLLASLVRYVESKCLFGGVTTSQGIALASDAGIETYYRGVMRNVEEAEDSSFIPAKTHIADVEAKDWKKFKAAVSGKNSVILHLSEGKDDKARAHFLALQNGADWAITDKLVGIHCAALTAQDFGVLVQHGGSMVWSPLSNYLLYGDTADIKAALAAGVRVALGSDWSPSGSKNLLGELKVAKLVAQHKGVTLADRDLIAMVTRNPAKMVQWDGVIGSLENGKRADLLVVAGQVGDPYSALVAAKEADIELVTVDGVPRYGTTALMTALGATPATVTVGGQKRGVVYHDPAANPTIEAVTLDEATQVLTAFFGSLPEPKLPGAAHAHAATKEKALHLALDETDPKKSQRPLLPHDGKPTGWSPAEAEAKSAGVPLVPLKLDGLTADDAAFRRTLAAETNLPSWLTAGLAKSLG